MTCAVFTSSEAITCLEGQSMTDATRELDSVFIGRLLRSVRHGRVCLGH